MNAALAAMPAGPKATRSICRGNRPYALGPRRLEFEAEIRKGKYVLTAKALESARRAGMTIRDGMLAVPGSVACALASETDEREVERILTDELRSELSRVSKLGRGAEA